MEPPIQNGTAQIIEVDDSNVNDISIKPKVEPPKQVKCSNTFSEMRSGFLEEISKFLLTGNVDRLKQKWNSFQAKDITKRVSMEQALKDKTVSILNTLKKTTGYSVHIQDLKKYLDSMMVLCKNELITVLLFLNILSDIIDSSPVPLCEKLFEFIEENLSTWKSPPFSVGKNNILRMCNDLLRRISKAQTTVFCGRILLFLAMFFPFSERSGLNIVSEFNTDALYKNENSNQEEPVEIVDVSLKLDDEFYSKFWQLQEYFRNPNQCYNKIQWQEFVEIANLVIGVFKKHKLNRDSVDRLATQYESEHFTKFLTSRKLLVLQMSDSNFRRIISFQLLVLFQYLTGHIKTKPENHELPPDGNDWIKEVTERIYTILKDTPPDGEEFVTLAKNMILREDEWSSWKNEGCPGLKKVMPADTEVVKHSTIEDSLGQKSFSVLTTQSATNVDTIFVPSKMGSPQAMTLKHSFDEYISSLTPAPELKDFLAEAIEESERKMEPEKKKVADPSFAWLSVKLISLKAPTFFSNSHSAVPSMSEYVDIMCKKLYRDLNPGLLLPPYMPAPKSVVAKTKKPLTATAANSTSLKKRLKKPKLSDMDKTVVKVVKGGVVKLIKTTKGIKVSKDGDSETNQDEPESGATQTSKVKMEEKTADEEKTTDKPKVEKTNNSMKLASKSNSSSTEKQASVKKIEKVPEKPSDKTFAVPTVPTKSEKYKSERSEKVSKSPSPKPQRKPEEKLRKDDRRGGDKREDKKVEKREKRSRERSVESRKEKTNSDRFERGKTTSNKSPGKRKASPKRDDHKSNKVIRVDDTDEDITRDQIHDLAKSIASNWKKVAERLGYKSDEIEYFEQDASSDYQRAMNVLLAWVNDEEDATKEMLRKHLKYLGLSHAVSVLSK